MNINFKKRVSEIPYHKFITGSNFANLSDIVYAEAVNKASFDKLDKNNIETYVKVEDDIFIYSIKNFTIKENQIIFCKTDYLLDLFAKLNNVKLSNLKLITHQAATPIIDKKLYKMKPKCISEWYSINIGYINDKLIPIPLGLGNYFSDVGLQPTDFTNNLISKESSRINKIFCSFDTETNPIRKKYMDFAEVNPLIFYTSEERLDKYKFFENLNKYNYSLCPAGVGMDTHRFWESLYSGCVPVAKKNYIYDKYFFENYISFTDIKELNDFNGKKASLNDELLNKLNLDFWEKLINLKKVDSEEVHTVDIKEINYKKDKLVLKKKYTRFKILNSKFSLKIKFLDLFKTFFGFNEKLYIKYWH